MPNEHQLETVYIELQRLTKHQFGAVHDAWHIAADVVMLLAILWLKQEVWGLSLKVRAAEKRLDVASEARHRISDRVDRLETDGK